MPHDTDFERFETSNSVLVKTGKAAATLVGGVLLSDLLLTLSIQPGLDDMMPITRSILDSIF